MDDNLKYIRKGVAMISIPEAEYDQLILGAKILAALQASGVDEWVHFEEAIGTISE